MKNHIVITGGAGFVGSNLIETILKDQKKYKIISIDNYSSGTVNNHIKSKRVKYIKGNTKNISSLLSKYKNNIKSLYHFGEFSRIYQSFEFFDKCYESNVIGSKEVFNFCRKNKIKLIYSATSASLGKLNNKNLSPYAFTKSKNLELLNNLKKWFNLKYSVVFFYNVYGPRQISSGKMATVIGIFERQFKQKKKITVVKPGSQKRRFTHILDTIKICLEAEKKSNLYYSIFNKKSYSILEVAKLFKSKIKFLPKREGERYSSYLAKMYLSKKILQRFGKRNLKDYIENVISEKSNKKKI